MTTWNNLETFMHGHLLKKKGVLLTITVLVYKDWGDLKLWDEKVQPWWQSSMKCIIKTMFWRAIFYVENNLNWHLFLLESWNSLDASADLSHVIFIFAHPEMQAIFFQISSDFKQKNHVIPYTIISISCKALLKVSYYHRAG